MGVQGFQGSRDQGSILVPGLDLGGVFFDKRVNYARFNPAIFSTSLDITSNNWYDLIPVEFERRFVFV
jgi:hypothetical protein